MDISSWYVYHIYLNNCFHYKHTYTRKHAHPHLFTVFTQWSGSGVESSSSVEYEEGNRDRVYTDKKGQFNMARGVTMTPQSGEFATHMCVDH